MKTKLNCEQMAPRENPTTVALLGTTLTITADPVGSIVSVSGSLPSGLVVSDQTGEIWNSANSSKILDIQFNGGAGNDVFVNASTLNSFALGDAGDIGGVGGIGESDYFYGGPGEDVFIGSRNGGSLFIDSYPSVDVMIGGNGNDFFLASGGNDRIYTGKGFNYVYAPAGFTDLDGTYGNGVVFKGAGGEIVSLNPGIKVIDI